MSEKSPAVLQTNRNIWDFFQLCGDAEIGFSPCCPSLRDLHVWLLPGALVQTMWDATQSLSTQQISQHLVSWLLPPPSLRHLKKAFAIFFFMWKAFWKLDITRVHYEMKIPHVFRMEKKKKKSPGFKESFVSLLKTRALTMPISLPNEKFPLLFSGLWVALCTQDISLQRPEHSHR